MTEPEFKTIKELYKTVADENSGSYETFRQKLHRLSQGNVTTVNRVTRNLNPPKPNKGPVRDFVAYDGEGEKDKYILLANSTGEYVVNRNGLSTLECLEFLAKKYSEPVKRVFFSFGYDINFIIKDLNAVQMDTLLKGRKITYKGYLLHWIPGKIFSVNNLAYYDVFSFFTTSFVNAIGSHLGKEAVSKTLLEGKRARGTFETWDLDKIIKYNAEELRLLVLLMEKLRNDFNTVGVNLQEWYGPGAVAKYWFKEHGVMPREQLTIGAIKALNSAYYGGRFEQLVIGRVNKPYEYDLHSAYPTVMADLPNFKTWKPTKSKVITNEEFSIWHITFDLREHIKKRQMGKPLPHSFCPLPVRSMDGHLTFPLVGKGWYWYPEIKVMLDYFPEANIKVHSGYIAETYGKPFTWVRDLYYERLRLKRENNQAQFAVKVGLNSLYGKTAQRVGKAEFFSLSWAGYITAKTRANIARAGYDLEVQQLKDVDKPVVLGFATDAIFTTKPCNLPLSDNMGDWEETQADYGIFFQSGIYRLVKGEQVSDRYRGSPLRKGIDDIIDQLQKHPYKRPEVRLARFVSNSLANQSPNVYGPHRLQFVQIKQEIKLDSTVKRFYLFENSGPKKDSPLELRINFRQLLSKPINSSTKVYVDDNLWWATWDLLWYEKPLRNIESHARPMIDSGTMRLLQEALDRALDAGFTTIDSLDGLPVVEDPDDISENEPNQSLTTL